MKKLYLILVAILLGIQSNVIAQDDGGVSIGKGNSAADSSAILELVSSNKGLLIPRLTSSEREGISSPANGLMVYDTDERSFYYWSGAKWNPLTGIKLSSGTTEPKAADEGDLFFNTGDNSLYVYISDVWEMVGSSLQVLTLDGTTLKLLKEGQETGSEVDLSVLFQNLTLSGTKVSISHGNTIDLAGIDSDKQTIALSGSVLSITNGNSVDFSSLLSGDMLKSVYDTDGNKKVDDADKVNGLTVLTEVPANAVFSDSQTLSLSGTTLSISGGNSIILPTGNGTGDMLQSVYDNTTNGSSTGVVDNAEKVNGLTVQTAVPLNAVFTDDQNAGEVAVTPNSTLGLSSNNVQDALEELQGEITTASSGGMTSVVHDTSLTGNGVTGNELGIADNGVSLAKIADGGASQVLGTDASGNPQWQNITAIQDGTGTDDQTISDLSLSGNTLQLTLEGDANGQKTLDLSSVDNQNATEVALSSAYVKPSSGGTLNPGESIESAIGKLEKGLESAVSGGGEMNVQADWNVTDTGSDAYILNKPTLGTASTKDAGTLANNVVQLDANGKLPAVDGSQLTNMPSAPVSSVAGKTGVVSLTTDDVTVTTDKNYVTAAQLTILGNTSGTNSGDQNATSVALSSAYVKPLSGGTLNPGESIESAIGKLEKGLESAVAGGGEMNVQADWNVTDTGSDAYILNKPTLGTASTKDAGTSANNVVQLDANGKLPAVDGSQLTNMPSAPVSSVAGRTGDIILAKADVGLSEVDNTSDLGKPVSTATQTALDAKANTADLGTASTKDAGTSANNVVQLDANGKLPAVDGSQLTNLNAVTSVSVVPAHGITGIVTNETTTPSISLDLGAITPSSISVNESQTPADASAVLDVTSTDKGILIPRMTQAQRDAISSPAEGLMVYQTDGTAGFYYYNGTAWTAVGGSGGADVTTASNGLTESGDDVQLGGTLTAATEINQAGNNLTFTTGGGRTIINGGFQYGGGPVFIKKWRVATTLADAVFQEDDYIIEMQVSGAQTLTGILPDPATTEVGRVIVIRNSASRAGTGGTYTFGSPDVGYLISAATTIANNLSMTLVCDGTKWVRIWE